MYLINYGVYSFPLLTNSMIPYIMSTTPSKYATMAGSTIKIIPTIIATIAIISRCALEFIILFYAERKIYS